jgi:hypothetical protein
MSRRSLRLRSGSLWFWIKVLLDFCLRFTLRLRHPNDDEDQAQEGEGAVEPEDPLQPHCLLHGLKKIFKHQCYAYCLQKAKRFYK